MGFFRWTFSNYYYWLISVVWVLFAGLEELRNKWFTQFLGIFVATLLIVMVFFRIAYFIKKTISRNVDKEIKKRMRELKK